MSPKPATLGVRALLIPAGGACLILGALTLTGWVLHMPGLTRAGPSFNPMVANAAVGFVLDGLALILLAGGRRRSALPGAAWSLIAGVLTLLEYGLSIDLGFDQMLAADRITQSTHAGRLAPNTALCFVLCGLALWCAARARPSRHAATIVAVLGAIVMAIGAATVLGYLAGYPTYAWGQWTHMAANTGVGFITLGLGVVAAAALVGERDADTSPRWPAFATGCVGLTITLSFAYALEKGPPVRYRTNLRARFAAREGLSQRCHPGATGRPRAAHTHRGLFRNCGQCPSGLPGQPDADQQAAGGGSAVGQRAAREGDLRPEAG